MNQSHTTEGRMNLEIKKLWIDALRSGKYIQGNHRLKRCDDTMCCLGVLVDIYIEDTKEGKWSNENQDKICYNFIPNIEPKDGVSDKCASVLPNAVCKWAGLESNNPIVEHNNTRYYLTRLNDDVKLNFEQIAQVIEESL